MEAFLEYLKEIDTTLLLGINGNHSPFWDGIMMFFSSKRVWIPMYLALVYLLYRIQGPKILYILIGAGFLMFLSDQGSVHLFKNVFLRLRPCHEPSLTGLLHRVNDQCGGQYGFISSHATNTFAIATFLFGFFTGRYRWLAWTLIGWAAVVSFSRIYLGVHYPGDVIAGIMFGSVLGWGVRKATLWWITFRTHGR